MSETREPKRHPSAAIPLTTVEELAYRLWLRRLDPPMTPEESKAMSRTMRSGKTWGEAERLKAAMAYLSLTRDFLRVAVDMGMIAVQAPE